MAGRYRYYKRKLYFSTADRILLHLLEYVGREGEFNQPDDLTQFGIADAIGLGRSTVSKSIRRLVRDKFVRAQRAHVPSGKLRRTVYLLTQEGVAKAGQRRREIEEEVVIFRDPGGAERRLRTGQVPNLLPEYATLLDVAAHISEGVFDLAAFRGRRGRRLVDFTERVPRLRYFFGREQELLDMDAWLDSSTERVLIVSGLTGIGKTTLLARKLEDWREKRHVFFHRIMTWTTLRNVALQLAEFLNRLSKKELAHYIEATQNVDIEQTVEIVAANLDGVDAVLFYDDYHAAEPAVRDFFYALRAALETTEGAKLVVAGRHVPPFYDRRDVRVKHVVREMPLSGLDAASAEKILENRNLLLPREAVDNLLRQTGGHPLFLELADFGTSNVVGDIHRYLNEELFSKVTEQEARILTLASVFRYPAPADALYALEDVDPATLESLVEQSLLREVSTKVFDVHDIVRSFFVEMSSPRDRKRFHRLAAQHYLSIPESDPLEALYHLVEAADVTGAARLAVKEGRNILRGGHSEELLHRLDALLPAVEDAGHSTELRLLKAHALNVRGELDQAVTLYGEILQLPSDGALEPKIAEAHRALGDILRREGSAPPAQEHFDAALRLYRTLERSEGEAETLLSMGTLAEDRADFPRAERLYERAINLSHAHGLRLLEAEAQFAFSRILGARGVLEGALDRKRRALAIAEGLADWHLQARFNISTGATLYELRRYDEAMAAYEQGIDTARRIGDLRMLAYGLYNAAGAYIRQDDLLRAESSLKEAEALFRKLREPLMDALLLFYFGAIWEKRGKWGVAKQNLSGSLAKLREGGHDFDYARVAVTAAHLFNRNGESGAAVALLEDAIAVGKRIRAIGLVEEAQQDLVRLAAPTKDRRDGKSTPGPTATS